MRRRNRAGEARRIAVDQHLPHELGTEVHRLPGADAEIRPEARDGGVEVLDEAADLQE